MQARGSHSSKETRSPGRREAKPLVPLGLNLAVLGTHCEYFVQTQVTQQYETHTAPRLPQDCPHLLEPGLQLLTHLEAPSSTQALFHTLGTQQ